MAMFLNVWRIVFFIALCAVSGSTFAQSPIPIPERRIVTDLTGTLSKDEQQSLTQKLRAFEDRKGSQIAVLIVPTTASEGIEQYALRVSDTWKLGRKGIDDGTLLVIAKNDRKLRIETRYGVEGPLPDAMAKRIIAEVITPLFKQGQFYGGIDAGVDRILNVIDREPMPKPASLASASTELPAWIVLFLIIGCGIAFLTALIYYAVVEFGDVLRPLPNANLRNFEDSFRSQAFRKSFPPRRSHRRNYADEEATHTLRSADMSSDDNSRRSNSNSEESNTDFGGSGGGAGGGGGASGEW